MRNIKYLKENGVDVDKSIELFGDLELYNGTMEDFLDSIDSKLEKLKTFKEDNQIQNYAIFAHSVKSDARYLGFTSVAEVALKHEMAGKEDNAKFVNDNYEELISMVNAMIDTVKSYLFEEDQDNIEIDTNTKKTLLVVDDAPLITNLASKILGNDYNLIVFNDSKKAYDYIAENSHTIDGILLDLNMPEVNGFDILNYLNNNNLFMKIKVSIITGDESLDTIEKAFRFPIVDVLNKPFSVDKLQSVVNKTFN